MGIRGVKPQAPEVQKAKGAYRKNPQRENKEAPQANGGEPAKPADLDEKAGEKWDQLCDDLRSMGVLSSELGDTLTAYCTSYSEWVKARAIVAELGMLVETGSGSVKRNPALLDVHKFRDQMNRMLPELGLTPSSRGRLVSIKPQADDHSEISDLMERLGGSFN